MLFFKAGHRKNHGIWGKDDKYCLNMWFELSVGHSRQLNRLWELKARLRIEDQSQGEIWILESLFGGGHCLNHPYPWCSGDSLDVCIWPAADSLRVDAHPHFLMPSSTRMSSDTYPALWAGHVYGPQSSQFTPPCLLGAGILTRAGSAISIL